MMGKCITVSVLVNESPSDMLDQINLQIEYQTPGCSQPTSLR